MYKWFDCPDDGFVYRVAARHRRSATRVPRYSVHAVCRKYGPPAEAHVAVRDGTGSRFWEIEDGSVLM